MQAASKDAFQMGLLFSPEDFLSDWYTSPSRMSCLLKVTWLCCCYSCVYFHRDLKIKIPKVNSSFQHDLYEKQRVIFLSPVNNCHENVWGWKDGGIRDERRDLCGCMAAAEQRLRKAVAQCADVCASHRQRRGKATEKGSRASYSK